MLWYYTTQKELAEVEQRGQLTPERLGDSAKETPSVWFSSNPRWEPAANLPWNDPAGGSRRLTQDQTFVLGGGLARIGVAEETAPMDWQQFKQQSGIPAKAAKELYQAAIQANSRPGQWHGTFDPVPQSKWLTIEVLEGDAWVKRAE